MTLSKKPFENIEGKGENAGDQHFLLFPQCFQPFQRQIIVLSTFSPFSTKFSTLPKLNFNFSFTFILSSANALNLDQSVILSFGKELTLYHTFQFETCPH